jgi:ditrans,polycis-polyprenyl diphosphate synthase
MLGWIENFPGYGDVLSLAKTLFGKIIQTGAVPKHVAFVMDGNRRYAKKQNIELKEGHNAGFESMAKILEICYECGVQSATVFAFSIENFKRNKSEIDWLMELAKTRFAQLVENGELCERYGIQIRILGDKSLLPKDVLKVLNEAEELTRNNTRAILNVCFPYTSRYEITQSLKRIVKGSNRLQSVTDIDEKLIEDNLLTGGQPPLDLFIRTSGVNRLSDFLLWQVSAKDVMIEPVSVLWPDLKPYHMAWILIKYSFIKSKKLGNEDKKDV